MSIEIKAPNAPQFPLPFSHALRAGDFVYVSGQVGVYPETRELAGDTIEAQTTQSVRNIEAILEAAGLTLDHVIKVNAHLSDLSMSPAYNKVYETLFSKPYPTRTTVQSGLGNYLIEIDVIAYAPTRRGEG
ncbi:RidA family protein [Paenibacillus flagellatus]|uniref:YjgF-like translation initiation inhibitor n=1 Tax=Paenibacillus flagellatus TaxID=2211139 RepID=A0A2V5K8K7_9BACL|nr:RidA family protein [Paenibacillus flagellatus]PYI55839.1 YjgF-like translation initiation inhibitor [Paenibacillus flagellatus]